MDKSKKNYGAILEPNDMPSFLNEVATLYFRDNQEIMEKLAQCSIYISMVNYLEPKYERIF
jgi:hypothetical protein